MPRSDQESRACKPSASDREGALTRVRALNDVFRRTFVGGRCQLTSGVSALDSGTLAVILHQVAQFETFDAGNDPYGEHDFGAVTVLGITVFWKIDYYDKSYAFGSPDPADPEVTARVMTVMLASEY